MSSLTIIVECKNCKYKSIRETATKVAGRCRCGGLMEIIGTEKKGVVDGLLTGC